MERKLYSENFERFLKGHADKFKMSPSKKVWHGIYNDLHPGRKWPSITMSLVFLFTLVIIGHLNTNTGHKTPLYNLATLQKDGIKKNPKITTPIKHSSTSRLNTLVTTEDITVENNKTDDALQNQQTSVIKNMRLSAKTVSELPDESEIETKNDIDKTAFSQNKIEIGGKTSYVNDIIISSEATVNVKADKEQPTLIPSNITSETNINLKNIALAVLNNTGENLPKIRKSNPVAWSYYISPSVGYRSFSDSKIDKSVNHKLMIGYEAGTAMSINIYKNLQFTTGFQVNYSGYKIRANNVHPTLASLVLNSDIAGQSSTYSTISTYGSGPVSEFTKLKNYSLQASLPIGLQYVFAGNDNIKFGAAAAFQPSYIIADKAYLLSTDTKNYVADKDLYRRWNINTNLSPYVAFKSNSFNWQIGPQVRYQLLSTYTKQYPVKEHLINYGIRIGISNISK